MDSKTNLYFLNMYLYIYIYFFQNQIDTIYISIFIHKIHILYAQLDFSLRFFFLFPRLDDVDCPAPAEKMRFSYRLSVLEFTDGIAMGVGGAMRWELMIYTP